VGTGCWGETGEATIWNVIDHRQELGVDALRDLAWLLAAHHRTLILGTFVAGKDNAAYPLSAR
jgi:hypothetical protein